MEVQASSLKKEDKDFVYQSNGDNRLSIEKPSSYQFLQLKEVSDPFNNMVVDEKRFSSSVNKIREPEHMRKPRISLPKPVVFSSTRPISELDSAATKLQKVYKSYRTRRNLADCAVVVEELWSLILFCFHFFCLENGVLCLSQFIEFFRWKALDFATLKLSSVSFFNVEKKETAASRWSRARTRAAKVGKGLSKDENAQKLALQHWLEAIDPRHRYGHNLHFYYDVWFDSKSTQPFFYCSIVSKQLLFLQFCFLLLQKEREEYQVVVENGKLVYRQTGIPINTVEDRKWIFVLSTSRALYVGKKKKGLFQHSSFLSGGATTAAGRLVALNGVLKAIWPYSGHYLPTENNFKEFISFLEEHAVDLTNVKRCAVDDDSYSYKDTSEDSLATTTSSEDMTADNDDLAVPIKLVTINQQEDNMDSSAKAPLLDMPKRLLCKWTSGVGPRIGCVKEYPTELQARALEQVNLSPRVGPGHFGGCVPIPSPRPSPKIKVSPRLSYMGIPSPRVSVIM